MNDSIFQYAGLLSLIGRLLILIALWGATVAVLMWPLDKSEK